MSEGTTPEPRIVERAPGPSHRRWGWGMGDQALSSLTNFGLTLVVVRHVDIDELGAFSLAFATYLTVLGVSRSLSTEPLLVRYSASTTDEWKKAAAEATGASLGIGLLAGVCCLLAGWLLEGETGRVFLTIGVFLPGLILQDSWRFAFIAAGRTSLAFANDLIWTVALCLLLLIVVVVGDDSTVLFTAAWGTSATVAAIGGVIQARLTPRAPWQAWRWWRTHRDLGLPFLADFAANAGVYQITTYAIGVLAGLGSLGTLRAGEVLMGPFNVLFMGGTVLAIAEGARMLKEASSPRLRKASIVLSSLLIACGLLWGLVLMMVPDEIGISILGPTWIDARAVLVPMILVVVGRAAIAGASVGLRALAAARRGLRARLATAPLVLLGGVIGAAIDQAVGAAWGFALANAAAAAIWWWQYAKAGREYEFGISEATGQPSSAPG